MEETTSEHVDEAIAAEETKKEQHVSIGQALIVAAGIMLMGIVVCALQQSLDLEDKVADLEERIRKFFH